MYQNPRNDWAKARNYARYFNDPIEERERREVWRYRKENATPWEGQVPRELMTPQGEAVQAVPPQTRLAPMSSVPRSLIAPLREAQTATTMGMRIPEYRDVMLDQRAQRADIGKTQAVSRQAIDTGAGQRLTGIGNILTPISSAISGYLTSRAKMAGDRAAQQTNVQVQQMESDAARYASDNARQAAIEAAKQEADAARYGYDIQKAIREDPANPSNFVSVPAGSVIRNTRTGEQYINPKPPKESWEQSMLKQLPAGSGRNLGTPPKEPEFNPVDIQRLNDMLAANPQDQQRVIQMFESIYGPGSADKALGR